MKIQIRKFYLLALIAGTFLPVVTKASTLSLSPTSSTITVGNIISVNIVLNTGIEQIDGVGIKYLNYNPAQLEVQDENPSSAGVQIAGGTLMPVTQANSVNTATGQINFSQVTSSGAKYTSNNTPVTLATLRFRALTTGTANVTFNFTPGLTTDTNVASDGTDVLTAATSGTFTLNPVPVIPNISSISPASGTQGSTLSAIITGTNLSGATTVTFSSTGVSATVNTGGTATNLPITITIGSSATTGSRTFSVTTPNGAGNTLNFSVTRPPVSNLSCTVSLEGPPNPNSNVFNISVYQPGTSTLVDQFLNRTPATGAIALSPTIITPGTYDILVASQYYLRGRQANAALASNASVTLPILLGGNLNDPADTTINEVDWSLMSPAWGSSSYPADINRDNVVNEIDFSIMNKNWGLTGN